MVVGRGHERVELGKCSVVGFDIEIVRYVVAMVSLRRREAWVEPDRVDAERPDVPQLLRQTKKVTDPVAISISEGSYIHLVNRSASPPGSNHHGA